MGPDPADLVSSIYNACWWLRNSRGKRNAQRQQAILAVGLAVRSAFQQTEDFEPLLAALLDGLSPRDDSRF